MRHPLPLACLVAALAISACGGSSAGNTSGAGGAHVASAPNTASTSAAAPATSPVTTTAPAAPTTTATTTPTGPPPCRAADLSLSYLGGQGATGHGELGFALRNTSGHSCTTIGYPGIQFLDQAGAALPTIPTHTTQDFFGAVPKLLLTVAPGATVSFRLGVTHGMTSTAGCATAHGIQVIPPNDTATLRTAIANGGAYECQTATVSPLAEGTSAYS